MMNRLILSHSNSSSSLDGLTRQEWVKIPGRIKSPLRYPGGKSRAVKIISEYIPRDTKELCSPFFGGGSLEIFCAQQGIRVYGYDNFKPLVDFWQCLLKDPNQLANNVEKYYPLKKEKFYDLQKIQLNPREKLENGTLFFVLNRASYSGSTLCGGMSSGGRYSNDRHPRFTKSAIERLRNFSVSNLTIELADFKESIAKHPNVLLYLDPPYLVKSKLYGRKGDLHKNFDHEGLAKVLKRRNNWILSYNSCREIREFYGDYVIKTPDWKYGMSNNKDSREALIFSHDIAKLNNLDE
jgi:DNA adenine methylase